jgi:hypothetical protein
MWQQRILLRATESVELINEEERLLTMRTTLRRCGDRLSHLGHTVACCGEAGGNGANSGGNDGRKRRLAGAWWPPEEE